jgi:hypothetical protein
LAPIAHEKAAQPGINETGIELERKYVEFEYLASEAGVTALSTGTTESGPERSCNVSDEPPSKDNCTHWANANEEGYDQEDVFLCAKKGGSSATPGARGR